MACCLSYGVFVHTGSEPNECDGKISGSTIQMDLTSLFLHYSFMPACLSVLTLSLTLWSLQILPLPPVSSNTALPPLPTHPFPLNSLVPKYLCWSKLVIVCQTLYHVLPSVVLQLVLSCLFMTQCVFGLFCLMITSPMNLACLSLTTNVETLEFSPLLVFV